ncbi:MAG: hypothetical protein V1736_04590 [Pseudomonadota bacterium]
MGALSVGDVLTGTIPSLLPSQKHYLKVYIHSKISPIKRRWSKFSNSVSALCKIVS